jgi:hypothetical protein
MSTNGTARSGHRIVLPLGLAIAGLGLAPAVARAGFAPPSACGAIANQTQACLNPKNACESAYLAAASSDPLHPCNGIIDANAKNVAATMPVKTALTTPLLHAGETLWPSVPKKDDVHPVPVDPKTQKASGLDGSYLGDIERYTTCVPRYPTGGEPMSIDPCWFTAKSFRTLRSKWSADGKEVHSCEELAYKAFADYSVFEDEAIKAGPGQHRQIYEKAFGTNRARAGGLLSLAPPYAIGTRGVAGGALKDSDGAPLADAIPFQKQIPKNDFYQLASPVGEGPVIIHTGAVDSAPAMLEGGTIVTLKSLKRKGLSLYGLVFEDETLKAEIDAGQAYYDESWAWHKEMGQKTSGFLDEELYAAEKKKEEYLALLAEREALVARIVKMLGHRRYLQFNRAAEMGPAPIINLPKNAAPAPVLLTSSAPANVPEQPAAPTVVNVAVTCTNGSGVICLFYQLEALDQRIEDALQAARADGCVGGARSAATRSLPPKCDWSPKVFTRRLLGLFQTQRERAYRECLFYTAAAIKPDGTFELTEKPSATQPKIAKDYNASVAAMREYFVDVAAFWKETVEKFGTIQGNSVVRADGDQFTEGGSVFGAHLGYDTYMSMGGFSNSNDCAAAFKGHGAMSATATAFGEEIPLMDALVDVSDSGYTAFFKVAGVTVLGSSDAKVLPVQPVNLVRGSFEGQKSFFGISVTIPVGPVPVALGGGISGRVGLEYSVTAGRAQAAGQQGQCLLAQAGVEGGIRPFAAVDGYLTAGVSAVILSVGIKGTLTLVEASLPITAGVGLIDDDGTPAIEMSSRADLRLTFLSGHISVYVEAGIWPAIVTFEGELVGWDGIVKDIPLFSVEETAPLAVFKSALAGMPSFEAAGAVTP